MLAQGREFNDLGVTAAKNVKASVEISLSQGTCRKSDRSHQNTPYVFVSSERRGLVKSIGVYRTHRDHSQPIIPWLNHSMGGISEPCTADTAAAVRPCGNTVSGGHVSRMVAPV